MKKRKPMGELQRTAICCLATWIASLGICGLVGTMVLREVIPYELGGAVAVWGGALCLFLACLVATKPISQRKLLFALAMAAAYMGAGLLLRAAMSPGIGIAFDYRAVLPFAAATLAGLLASRRPHHRRR